MIDALLVAIVGGLGAATRFWVDGVIRARGRTVLPIATIMVNVSGSLLIGLVVGAHLYLGLPAIWQLVLATGFCGGYTTFSAAMVESVRLVQQDERGRAVLAAVGTLLLAVGAVAAGVGIMAVLGG